MESRKVQRVGASTLSVSLPKDWVEKNDLRKGDIVLLEPLNDGALRLIPSAHHEDRDTQEVEYVVNADLCDEPGLLGRIVVGCYVIGRNLIRVRSKTRIRSEHIREVRTAVKKLNGVSIMNETPDEIEIHCSIDATRDPFEAVMKRLYSIGSTMQKEAVEALEHGDARLAQDAIGREDDADSMYWYALRLLLAAQNDHAIAEKIGIHENLPIVGNRLIAKNLEHVADYAENIAQNVLKILDRGVTPDPDIVRRIRRTSDDAAQIVKDGLSCIFVHDVKLANRAIERKGRVEEIEDAVLDDVMARHDDAVAVTSLRAILWSLRRIAEYGEEIAVIGINRYLERDSAICKPLEPHPALRGKKER